MCVVHPVLVHVCLLYTIQVHFAEWYLVRVLGLIVTFLNDAAIFIVSLQQKFEHRTYMVFMTPRYFVGDLCVIHWAFYQTNSPLSTSVDGEPMNTAHGHRSFTGFF